VAKAWYQRKGSDMQSKQRRGKQRGVTTSMTAAEGGAQ